MSLHDAIESLAVKLAHEILAAAIREASLMDLVSIGEGSSAAMGTTATRPRRGPAARPKRAEAHVKPRDLAAKIVQVLRRSPGGVRTETLRALAGGPKPVYQRTMLQLVASGEVVKTGEKRATTYRAG
jgi:hypothetical protein